MKLRKILASLAVALVAVLAFALPAQAAPAGTKGWYIEDGHYYYYNDDGSLRTNEWVTYGGKYYFCGDEGYVLVSSMVQYNNRLYYVNAKGNPVVNTWMKYDGEWSYFGADGKAYQLMWLNYGGAWYRFDWRGAMLYSCWDWYNDNWYVFGPDGKLRTGQWFEDEYGWHYANADGTILVESWKKANGLWYYFDDDGDMLFNHWKAYGGHAYYFGSKGACEATESALVFDNYITEGNGFSYYVPAFNIDYGEGSDVNEYIYDAYAYDCMDYVVELNNNPDADVPRHIGYTWNLYGEILSLIMYVEQPYNSVVDYEVFHIDIETGDYIYDWEILNIAGIDEAEYQLRAQDEVQGYFETKYANAPHDDLYYEQLAKTIDLVTINQAPLYFESDGSLWGIFRIYALAGPAYYQVPLRVK